MTDPTNERPIRWRPGVILLLLAPICLVGAWFLAGAVTDGDRTLQMVALIATLAGAVLLQAIWWLGFARLTWRGKALGVLGVAAIAGIAAATVRIDGYRGEMMPILAFRWEPTPEERAIAYFRDARSDIDRSSDAVVTIAADDWPQYRGPDREGVVPEAQIRTDWDRQPPRTVWRQPIGLGWSSFAVVGDRLYTQEQRGGEEAVVCYDAATGAQIWIHTDRARFSETLGGDGPRATPTVTNDAVYALGATGLLNCLDPVTGSRLWQREILADAGGGERVRNLEWGMAGSPLVWEGRVYVVPGGGKGQGVIAYEAATGEKVWASGDAMASYAAPRIETIGGVPHLIVFDAEGLKGYDPATGDLLWTYGPWTNQPKVNAAQPIVRDDRIFISSGYAVGSALLQISREGDAWKVEEVWRNNNEFKLKFNDAVLHDGHLYGIDEGILACYEFETGKRKWKNGRYRYGQLVLLGETLVILAEDGTLAAVKASPEAFEELARVPVLDVKTWNHPAYARGFLYVRNDREAACLDLRIEP
jgi:outer membrane protein assembly factor BamB